MTDSHIVWPAVKWQEGEIEPILQYLRLPYLHQSKKVCLVGISLQQGGHAASHSFVTFVDELQTEVAVDLLGRHAVMSWQGAVDEVRQLRERGKIL